MESIFIKIFINLFDLPFKILSWPFLWLLKRIYPLKKLENEIFLYPQADHPIVFQISDDISSAVFVFHMINSSLLDVTLEKLYINRLSVGEGVTLLNNINFMERGIIKRGSIKVIIQHIDLNDSQVRKLKDIKSRFCDLDITAYLGVKFYGEIRKYFINSRVICEIR